jgi:competence protein ComEC
VIYYLLLFVYFYFVENKHHRYQYLSLGIITSFLLISSLPLSNHFIYQVSYIDVGQGDASLIQYRNTNILIDTGGIKNNDIANDTLIPFLKKKRIYHLDYVFLTHNDYDHVGAFDTLKANYRIDDYNKDNNFTSITISNLTFYNLNPSSSNEENDDSLVLYFTIKNKTFLYLGDVSSSKEKEIVTNYPNLAISYLKVAHHGSKYSAYEGLISSYQVENAIISCGVNNYYSHPSSEMLTLLNKYQVTIYRTDLNGTISFKI